ncbi:BlaI/MecI/CopY family transcriptional regulator [Paenibacillus camelliae]|uniref:BlaI/MecI/CopY family transcriptional regulator n=1 Tax=Paenibacillus camelliae TaxID=512410 RepID=UPI00203D52D0|nr:BlaI/MecI/CopY family transcriptional regulator [Paenibacillus camelliae]MCM3632820.1 BlaI/MecI/CopY family transcriptional regulator [Paenibacillus camelliae]
MIGVRLIWKLSESMEWSPKTVKALINNLLKKGVFNSKQQDMCMQQLSFGYGWNILNLTAAICF